MQGEQIHNQTQEFVIFHQSSVTKAHCNIGTEKHPDVGFNCDFDHDKFFSSVRCDCPLS